MISRLGKINIPLIRLQHDVEHPKVDQGTVGEAPGGRGVEKRE